MKKSNSLILPRRQFIQASAGLVSVIAAPQVFAKKASQKGARSIAMHNLHTGEKSRVDYWIDGEYQPEALAEIDKILRDHRTNEISAIDTKLIDKLNNLQLKLEREGKEFEIISGYRSPASNAKLAAKSSKVAKKSYHMKGKAVDVQLPGCGSRELFNAAKSLKSGGVGYYGNNRFVHLDVGKVRSWGRK